MSHVPSVDPSPTSTQVDAAKPYWSPYLAGFGLGLVLLAAILVLGTGLGASGGFARMGLLAVNTVAPEHAADLPNASEMLAQETHFLKDGLVFGLIGVAIGGFFSAFTGRRIVKAGTVERGPNASKGKRLALALIGGALMGLAARIARGCTSGQALTGGAMLSLGSWAFMFAVFAGGFGFAYFVRKQWQ